MFPIVAVACTTALALGAVIWKVAAGPGPGQPRWTRSGRRGQSGPPARCPPSTSNRYALRRRCP